MKFALICLFVARAIAQTPAPAVDSSKDAGNDPAYQVLSEAFEAQRVHDYDQAIALFTKAAQLSPARADIRKNLAYTLLKTGDSEAARLQFGEAMRIDPADSHVALEYAFLCFEARDESSARKAEARRIFLHVRDSATEPAARATAAQAFSNIDEPLKTSIARWRQALASSPATFSAHYELAQLAEQQDDLDLAAASYTAAFRLLPERKSVLLELARVEKARGNPEGMMSALIAASRGGEPRASEAAREQLPDRYPYVYEFRKALELDPKSGALHRELAYLLLSMSENGQAKASDAETEFRAAIDAVPDDYVAVAQLGLLYLGRHLDEEAMPLLNSALAHADPATANRVRNALHPPAPQEKVLEKRQPEAPADPRALGERSYNAGFLKDALRYYTLAHEADPLDPGIILKLGWTNNLLHNDAAALHWFDLARRSGPSAIATEARRAYANLHPGLQRFRTTLWIYPLYSSRWSDLFGYGQIKTEMRLRTLPFRPYLSVRFVGDVKRTTGGPDPQNLSESAFIFGAGIATRQWHGGMAWFEAGKATSYLNGAGWRDYRGGVSYSKTKGASLAAEHSGFFAETTDDSVFISHFQNDLLNISQNKAGYTTVIGGLKMQPLWNANVTFDSKAQYWANFVETGPGFRFHPPGLPPSVAITLSAVRGIYLRNEGNPRRPNFNDFRAGVWYAFTK